MKASWRPSDVVFVALVSFSCLAAIAERPPESSAELRSFHGAMIVLVDATQGNEMEVWAKADNVRSEIRGGNDVKIVVIQRGDTLYTFSPAGKHGQKTRFEGGLASHGLIEQIALVKAKGKLDGTQQANGVAYNRYAYEIDAPREQALVLLEAQTSLPKDWLSIVQNVEGEPVASRTIFRDMQANVDVPDLLFELPPGVDFDEVPPGDLMATPRPPARYQRFEAPPLRPVSPLEFRDFEAGNRHLLTLAISAVSLIIVTVYRFSRAFCRTAEEASQAGLLHWDD